MLEEPRAAIGLDRVSKRFGAVAAVDDVSLEIAEGEFFSLLGPSGCGKTTTLRMVAGFERPDEGRLLLQGDDVTDVPTEEATVLEADGLVMRAMCPEDRRGIFACLTDAGRERYAAARPAHRAVLAEALG